MYTLDAFMSPYFVPSNGFILLVDMASQLLKALITGLILSSRQIRLFDLSQTLDSNTLLFLVVGWFPGSLASVYVYAQVIRLPFLLSKVIMLNLIHIGLTQLYSLVLSISFCSISCYLFAFFFYLITYLFFQLLDPSQPQIFSCVEGYCRGTLQSYNLWNNLPVGLAQALLQVQFFGPKLSFDLKSGLVTYSWRRDAPEHARWGSVLTRSRSYRISRRYKIF
jgi:hypothetical protein